MRRESFCTALRRLTLVPVSSNTSANAFWPAVSFDSCWSCLRFSFSDFSSRSRILFRPENSRSFSRLKSLSRALRMSSASEYLEMASVAFSHFLVLESIRRCCAATLLSKSAEKSLSCAFLFSAISLPTAFRSAFRPLSCSRSSGMRLFLYQFAVSMFPASRSSFIFLMDQSRVLLTSAWLRVNCS